MTLGTKLGLSQATSSGSFTPTANLVRVATHNNRIPIAGYGAASFDTFVFKRKIIIGADTPDLCLSFNNWFMDTGGVSTTGLSNVEIVEVALEKDDNSASAPFYFNSGADRAKTLAAGDADIQTDWLDASSLGLAKFSRGEAYWLKYNCQVATAGNKFVGTAEGPNTGEQFWFFLRASTTPSSVDTLGNFTYSGTTPGSASNPFMMPIVLGHVSPSEKVFVIAGDSIAYGANESATANTYYGIGYMQRSLSQSDHSLPRASINIARHSSQSTALVTANSLAKLMPYCAYGNTALVMYGTNDIYSGGVSLATLQTRMGSVFTELRTQGIETILVSHLMPRSTSTDSFATTANQTITTGWNTGETANLYNDWVDTLCGGDADYAFAPTSARDTVDPLKWAVTGAANYATSDGLHPSTAIHILLADDLRTVISSIM